MDKEEKAQIVQCAYTMFFRSMERSGFIEFCAKWFKHKNVEPLFDKENNFLYLENSCKMSILSPIHDLETIFSKKTMRYLKNFQNFYKERLYDEVWNITDKITDEKLLYFIACAHRGERTLDEVTDYFAGSEYSEDIEDLKESDDPDDLVFVGNAENLSRYNKIWLSLLKEANKRVLEDFAKNKSDVVKIKIGILEKEKPRLACFVNTEPPSFPKDHDEMFCLGDKIVLAGRALHDFYVRLRKMHLNVPYPVQQKKSPITLNDVLYGIRSNNGR